MFKTLPVKDLKGWEQNPREIKPEAFEALKKYISKYGLLTPLIVDGRDEKTVLGGNMRLRAIRELGWKEAEVKVVSVRDDHQALEVALLDNNGFGQYIKDRLVELVEGAEISLEDFHIDLRPTPLVDLLETEVELEEDSYQALEGENPPGVEEGDIWQLGRHKLMCGDSTQTGNLYELFGEEVPEMAFSDPPYGINVVKKDNTIGESARQYKSILSDEDTSTARSFYAACQEVGIKEYILWGGNYFTDFLSPSRCWLVWDKKNGGADFADVELAWTSYEKSAKLYTFMWNGGIREGDKSVELSSRVHPTQKPVGLFGQIFNDFKFESCFDGFGGSGSTLIACELAGRKCFMMELDPHYCSVIIDRWQQLTGETAEKISK